MPFVPIPLRQPSQSSQRLKLHMGIHDFKLSRAGGHIVSKAACITSLGIPGTGGMVGPKDDNPEWGRAGSELTSPSRLGIRCAKRFGSVAL